MAKLSNIRERPQQTARDSLLRTSFWDPPPTASLLRPTLDVFDHAPLLKEEPTMKTFPPEHAGRAAPPAPIRMHGDFSSDQEEGALSAVVLLDMRTDRTWHARLTEDEREGMLRGELTMAQKATLLGVDDALGYKRDHSVESRKWLTSGSAVQYQARVGHRSRRAKSWVEQQLALDAADPSENKAPKETRRVWGDFDSYAAAHSEASYMVLGQDGAGWFARVPPKERAALREVLIMAAPAMIAPVLATFLGVHHTLGYPETMTVAAERALSRYTPLEHLARNTRSANWYAQRWERPVVEEAAAKKTPLSPAAIWKASMALPPTCTPPTEQAAWKDTWNAAEAVVPAQVAKEVPLSEEERTYLMAASLARRALVRCWSGGGSIGKLHRAHLLQHQMQAHVLSLSDPLEARTAEAHDVWCEALEAFEKKHPHAQFETKAERLPYIGLARGFLRDAERLVPRIYAKDPPLVAYTSGLFRLIAAGVDALEKDLRAAKENG